MSASGSTRTALPPSASSTKRPPAQKFKAWQVGRIILLVVLAIAVVGFGTLYFTGYNYLQRAFLLSQSVPNSYAPHTGTLALNDPLVDNSNGYFWTTGSITNGDCTFTNAALHVKSFRQSSYIACTAQPTFSNFAFETRMTTINGDFGGIVFRSNPTNWQSYAFALKPDGNYVVRNYTDAQGTHNDLGSSSNGSPISNFNKGLGQSNLIAVVANGNQITLYVNNVQVTSITDSAYSQGQIGVFADDEGNATEVAFSDARVWTF